MTREYQLKPVERGVFRAYDIRGIIGSQLDTDAFYSIGRAIGWRLHELGRDTIYLARDGRLTSSELAQALVDALVQSGIHVIDLGAVATPVMYYATKQGDVDCGLMVTGSHNPADYNGIKIVLAGKTLVSEDIDILYALNQQGYVKTGAGHYETLDLLESYVQRVLQDITIGRPLKVVVDCGNGIAGPVIPEALTRLGVEIVPLYCEVDGRFPNHHPDPTILENLVDLKAGVAAHNADIGLAFDGDADRLGVVTNTGEVIWPDRLLMLYARDVLKRNPGASIVYDVKCSSHLAEVIEAAGGVADMCPTGHSIVKSIMKARNAPLAGEMSGHIFFNERWYGFDDALYSACRLLEIVSQSPLSVSEQFAQIPNSVNTPEIKIPIEDAIKFAFMQQFCNEASFPDSRKIAIDGLRVEFPHGWGLIRASNTTPCLVARFEAQDALSLGAIQQLFKSQLLALDNQLAIPF